MKIASLAVIFLAVLMIAYGFSVMSPLVIAGDDIPHPVDSQPTGRSLTPEPTGDPIPHPVNGTG